MRAAAERRLVQAGSVRTSCLTSGAGFPVILLHGMGAHGGFWQPVLERLSERFLVLAPDIAGFGSSTLSPASPAPSLTAWLADFMDAMGISRAHIVGHSLGGAIAAQFAIERSGRVERLVLSDSVGLGMRPLGLIAAALFVMPSNPVTRLILRRILWRNPADIPPADRERRGGRPSFDRNLARRILRATGWKGLPRIPPERLREIGRPTLLLWGERDPVVPVSIARRALSFIPGARLAIVRGSGHSPALESPVDFAEKLLEFLIFPGVSGGS